jgi:hypothetical protein
MQTRQALGVNGNTFQPISLERYQHALDDADSFAAWLDDYRGNLTHLRDALQGNTYRRMVPSAAVSEQLQKLQVCWCRTAFPCMANAAVRGLSAEATAVCIDSLQ